MGKKVANDELFNNLFAIMRETLHREHGHNWIGNGCEKAAYIIIEYLKTFLTGQIMDDATKNKLIAAGRQDIIEIYEVNKSGYAGVMPNGNIVDRRKHPEAIPVQENSLFGIPAPKEVPASK